MASSRSALLRIRRTRAHLEQRLAASSLLPGHVAYRRFVIGARARSGSNLLVSLLDSHPNIEAHGELFRELAGDSAAARLDRLFVARPRRTLAVGFKAFYYHPTDVPDSDLWDRLAAMTDLTVVHLTRTNVLRTLTSRKLAGRTNEWIRRGLSRGNEPPTVHFDVDELRAALAENAHWEGACRHRFAGRIVEITYEDLVADDSAVAPVLEALGVERRPLQTSLVRQHPQPLSELIENYEDLANAFAGTRWSGFFEG
jgi:LPS sulfotransferase NodH